MQIADIAKVVGASKTFTASPPIHTLLTDSRKVVYAENALFVALTTNQNDGHKYIDEVYEKGVRNFIVQKKIVQKKYPNANFIEVKNTLEALQRLVAFHRSQFNVPIIGITGSNGKTIIKEWLYYLLHEHFEIVRSPKSYNSQIGVPLSVWELQTHHTLGIFEAGISEKNEMQKLEKIIQPTIGIFTNIGEAHNENFISIKEKIIEKLSLFNKADFLIFCKDHKHVLEEVVKAKANNSIKAELLFWSKSKNANLKITTIQKNNSSTTITAIFKNQTSQIEIPFTDDASIENAIHCWLCCLHLDISQKEIQQKMRLLPSVAMRLEIKKAIHNSIIINDSYNSDLGALQIALDLQLQQTQFSKRTVILSDILQSGKRGFELYEEVADLLNQKKVAVFIGIGRAISKHKKIFSKNKKIKNYFYNSTQDFIADFKNLYFDNECILLKGARSFTFEKINQLLEERQHQTVMEVNLSAMENNYKVFKSLLKPQTGLMAMVKAFSYGSGSVEVANKLAQLGVKYLAVAYTDEGITLRKAGIKLPIMVMNPDDTAFYNIIQWNLEPEIYSLSILQKFIIVARELEATNYPIHLKLDTGMHRLGFEEQHINELLEILKNNSEIKIQSVFSHLAAADNEKYDSFTKQQVKRFENIIQQISKQIKYKFLKHIANTAGISRHSYLHYDMVRLGIGLYGIDSTPKIQKRLKPISRLKTTISQIKKVDVGESVGYSRRAMVTKPTTIGTVCIGYADGIPRRLGNGAGKMYVNGKLVPTIGNICMDMTMLDITSLKKVNEGDEVIVFGPELPITQVAEWASTIPYEIMTDVSQRVKRVYYEE